VFLHLKETASSESKPYLTVFSNGKQTANADTITPDKGGGNHGLRLHELLEAALATCLNTYQRMYAVSHRIELGDVSTKVTLDRSSLSEAVFNCSIELSGKLDDEQRKNLLEVAGTCAVRPALSRKVSF
jgi:putative redox protein